MKFGSQVSGGGAANAPNTTLLLGDLLQQCAVLSLSARLELAASLSPPGEPLALFNDDLAALPLPRGRAERGDVLARVAGALPSSVMGTALVDRPLGEVLPLLAKVRGRMKLGELPTRLGTALESNGIVTWRALARCQLDDVATWPTIGAAAVSALFRCAFEAAADVAQEWSAPAAATEPSHDGSNGADDADVATLFAHARRVGSGALRHLLEESLGPEVPDAVRAAARRLLAVDSSAAPKRLPEGAVAAAATSLLGGLGDTRERMVFERLCVFDDVRPAEVARALGISYERVRQLRQRVEARARELAEREPAFAEPVERLRHELGVAAPTSALEGALAGIGLPTPCDVRAALLLWLAGPYRSLPGLPSWVGTEGEDIRSISARLLGEDGGVHRSELLRKEFVRIGMAEAHVDAWLAAQHVRAHGEEAVFLVGPTAAVAERILAATGEAMTAEACRCFAGDDPARAAVWHDALRRDRRFVHVGGERFELVEWGGTPVASGPDCGPVLEHQPLEGDDDGPSTTLLVVVDEQLLAGGGGPVPVDLVVRLGIPPGTTRSLSTRYGPLALSMTADGPRRGSLRPIALAYGAAPGDVLVLRFEAGTSVVDVEVLSRPAGRGGTERIEATAMEVR